MGWKADLLWQPCGPAQEEQVLDEVSITLRVELRADTLLGPGKAALLQGIHNTGSIAAAGRRMGMSYKRARYLIDTLNKVFCEPAGPAECRLG